MGGSAVEQAQCYEAQPGAASAPLSSGYKRREPEKSVLHEVVRENLETFLAQTREDGRGLPRHVENELRKYIACGQLSEGFTRVVCRACGDELFVAFSCKGRAFCPSCCSRRMHESAALLVQWVLPTVPYRQWVLSYPRKLRLLLVRNQAAASESTRIFVREVFRWQRKKARRRGLSKPEVGAVCFNQFFGSKVNLHFHHHAVLPDGVFVEADGKVCFEKLARPERADLEAILERVVAKTLAMARRRGLLDEEHPPDALASLQLEAVQASLPLPVWPTPPKGLSAFLEGFSLEAGSHVHANDRDGLEHLLRYALRPPLALSRLSLASDGRVLLRLKRPTHDGTREVAFTPMQLLRRLAAIVPPARWNQTRYFGVFASRAKLRQKVVPTPASSPSPRPTVLKTPDTAARQCRYRLPWAVLLAKTFAIDVLLCPCGGLRRIVAFIPDPPIAQEALRRLGLPSSSSPISPPRWASQDELDLCKEHSGLDPPFHEDLYEAS
jgi:hypothetical protein